jgi:opacity protein-like surface antigen
MRMKLLPKQALALLFVCTVCSIHAQTVPAATESKRPLAVGAGFSGYNPDYKQGHLLGGALWLDYFPNQLPQILQGIGIEAEARDLSLGRSSSQPANLREDTAEGGLIYSWRHFHNVHPYGKFLMGYGNTDYESNTTANRYHDSRTITIAGGGVDVKVLQSVWVRADYEYQFWPNFFKHPAPIPAGQLNPEGFTVGVLYRFGGRHSR